MYLFMYLFIYLFIYLLLIDGLYKSCVNNFPHVKDRGFEEFETSSPTNHLVCIFWVPACA